MADRLVRETNPPEGRIASPTPQYYNPVTEQYERSTGSDGAVYYKDRYEIRGIASDVKPMDVIKGSTFLEIDTGDLYGFNGTTWDLLLEAIWT